MNTETEIITDNQTAPDLDAMPRADLPTIWNDYRAQIEKLKATAETLTVTDVSQVNEMKLARVTRLTLREVRIQIEKRRKELGEDALRRKQNIDRSAKELSALIEPLEARLLEQEKFAEIVEAKRKAELKAARETEIRPFVEAMPSLDLGEMADADWSALLAGAKAAHAARIEAAQKAEAERIAKEKAEREERERIRQENERLKREAEAREAQARKERAEAAAKLEAERKAAAAEAARIAEISRKEREAVEAQTRKEREAREKLEAERAAQLAEAKRKEDERIAAERAAALAPDKEKLRSIAAAVRALPMPTVSANGFAALNEIKAKAEGFAKWIERIASEIA